jgi:hypothetical protein
LPYLKSASSDHHHHPRSRDRAGYHVLSLIAPFLRGPSRMLLARLSQGYL